MEEDRKKFVGEVMPLAFENSKWPPYELTDECRKRLIKEGVLEEGEPK